MKIIAFGQRDEPATYHVVRELCAYKILIDGIWLDQKCPTALDKKLHTERFGDRIQYGDVAEFNVPIRASLDLTSQGLAEDLKGIDLVVNASTPGIFKSYTINAPALGILGVHPGKLPEYRGCSCVEWAIHNDDPIFNSVIWVEKGIDTGPVALDEPYVFSDSNTYQDVRSWVAIAGHNLIARAVRDVLGGKYRKHARVHSGGTYWKPMKDKDVESVKLKLKNGEYRYQGPTSADILLDAQFPSRKFCRPAGG